MKKPLGVRITMLLVAGLAITSTAAGQSPLDRLESGIRAANGQPIVTVAAKQRVYLGAVADDDAGRGVRVLSVRVGGPADRAGLQAQDLVVGAAGRKIHSLSELSTILNNLNPGDHVSLEYVRGTRPLRTDVVLGATPGAAQPGQPGPPSTPPPTGFGAGPSESIPPPPGEAPAPDNPTPALLPEGPAIGVPNQPPVPPTGPQAQIDDLRRRVAQLERKVEQLERALAESRRK